ncbi:MAG: NADH-ubiquinone oxidoreductase chain [Dehalococcoidia bacterium]|nr:NADH-ubiquinone oxidoreductase chain [Dehalococcoidia bacterium]
MLTAIVFLPMLGALAVALLPGANTRLPKQVAAVFTFVALGLSLWLYTAFDPSAAGPQFVEWASWIPALNVHYYLGVDGISLPMVILTTLLGFLSVIISWNINHRTKEYFAWLLILETAILGVFTSLDFFLFFLFWELELVPMYFLIAIWGTPPPLGRREYSAMKFLIYTILGGASMLVGILLLYFTTGTFDMV